MATLSSLAEDPERIKARFITKERNDAGIYGMTFFINNREQAVIVDDQFPAANDSRPFPYPVPLYAQFPSWNVDRLSPSEHGDGGELWVMLLEKAWAKLHGSYARIVGGWSTMVSQHLTGFPSEHMEHEKMTADELWSKICRYDALGYSLNTTTLM